MPTLRASKTLGTKAQVAKGAKLLDTKDPGWAEKVNTKKLQMMSNLQCILGQLGKKAGCKGGDPAFEYGENLGLTEDKFVSHGFESADSKEDQEAQVGFWKEEIAKRLEKVPVPTTKKTVKKKTA